MSKTENRVGKFLTIALLFAAAISIGCEEVSSTAINKVPNRFLESSISQPHGLSWMGGKSHPLTKSFQIPDPENADIDVSPGGIVLTDVVDGLPLDRAELRAGDAIVRVAENWLPIKEDSTLDFVKMIEDQVNAQKDEIEVGYIRSGKYATASLKTDLTSLDEDLPLANKRFIDSSTAILKQLVELQQEDGSFLAVGDDPEHQLIVSSLCGLALCSADESIKSELAPSLKQVKKYLEGKLSSAEFARELNPLTAAYICNFLAECDLSPSRENWTETVKVLSFAFASSQHDSGGWNVSELAGMDGEPTDEEASEGDSMAESSEELASQPDVFATFTTNVVLTAVGALERAGFSIENDMVEKGVAYLHDQADLRIPSSLDRRTKGILSAGTVVALVALNLDQSDLKLRNYLKNAQERAHDMYSAPRLALPGMLHSAIASRQLGNESWLQQHNATKHQLVSMHDELGRYVAYPGVVSEPLEWETFVASPAWNTAHLALLHSMQSKNLRRILAIETPENLLARDSSGKQLSKAAANAKVMKMDLDTSDPEALKKMIMEQLKAQGMDVDPSKMKIKTIETNK